MENSENWNHFLKSTTVLNMADYSGRGDYRQAGDELGASER